jgi:hypothetical protein
MTTSSRPVSSSRPWLHRTRRSLRPMARHGRRTLWGPFPCTHSHAGHAMHSYPFEDHSIT